MNDYQRFRSGYRNTRRAMDKYYKLRVALLLIGVFALLGFSVYLACGGRL